MKYKKCEKGEIWVRFKNKAEYTKNRTPLIERLVASPDVELNTCEIKEYISDENLLHERFGLYSYESFQALQDAFGIENVKFVSTGTKYICDTEFTEPENIERIADNLERIRICLEKIAGSGGE